MKRPALFFLVLNSICVAIFSGCGSGGGGSDTAPGANLQASSTIGVNGGTVEVTNPDSPIYGTKVDIPPGALNEDNVVSISLPSAAPEVPFPGSLLPAGLNISFQPDNLKFNRPISITIPYNDNDGDGLIDGTNMSEDGVYALTFTENSGQWLYALKISQNNSDKTIKLITDSFSIYASAVDERDMLETSKASIFTIDGLSFSKIFPGYSDKAYEEFRPSYLRRALISQSNLGLQDGDVYSYSGDINSGNFDADSSWSGDPDLTPQLIHGSDKIKASVRMMLRSEFNKAKSANKNFVLVTHSWGTVLGFLGLQYCQNRFDAQYDIVPDLVITLSSPLGTGHRDFNLSDPFFPPLLSPVVSIMTDLVSEYTDTMIDITHLYSRDYYNSPKFKFWINYYSFGDIISGPINTVLNEAEDRKFHDENLLTNYSSTTQDHGVSSLDEDYWKEYLDSDQISSIAVPFRSGIENILKSYISQ